MTSEPFGEAYYQRFYLDPETRVYSAKEHDALARYVVGFAEWNQLPTTRILDVGAGVGLWRDWIARHLPEAQYTGTEVSAFMAKKCGYVHCDIAHWRSRSKYDLIICQGVLQYLSDAAVESAVANIAAMARGLVFFEALTKQDLEERADRDRTDGDVHVRSGRFYRQLFRRHFDIIGAGLYWPRDYESPFWELDVGYPSSR